MKAQCIDNNTIELTDNGEKSGSLTYNGLFSSKARAVVGNNSYEITPKGIFNTHIYVKKNGKEIASLQMNWKGHIIIAFESGQTYILKSTGTFHHKYLLEDKDQYKLMLLHPDFNWSKFSYNYTITYEHKPQDLLLVLLAVYAANYYVAAMSGVM